MSDERKIIEYGVESYREQRLATRDRDQLRALLIAAPIVFVLIAVVFLFLRYQKRPANTVICMSQLRQVGTMMQTYAINERAYPDSLATLAMSKYARQFDTLLCCPATTAKPVSMPTTQAAIAAVSNPANCSYIYLPPTTQPAANQILLLDRTAVHSNGKFANVLTGDSTVRSVTAAQLQAILQQINTGQTKIFLPP